jgi:hypothetical protein
MVAWIGLGRFSSIPKSRRKDRPSSSSCPLNGFGLEAGLWALDDEADAGGAGGGDDDDDDDALLLLLLSVMFSTEYSGISDQFS